MPKIGFLSQTSHTAAMAALSSVPIGGWYVPEAGPAASGRSVPSGRGGARSADRPTMVADSRTVRPKRPARDRSARSCHARFARRRPGPREFLEALRAAASVLEDHAAALDRLDRRRGLGRRVERSTGRRPIGPAGAARGWPGTDLAGDAGCGVSPARRGARRPSPSLADALADGAGAPASDLAGRRLAAVPGRVWPRRCATRTDSTARRLAIGLELRRGAADRGRRRSPRRVPARRAWPSRPTPRSAAVDDGRRPGRRASSRPPTRAWSSWSRAQVDEPGPGRTWRRSTPRQRGSC